MYYTEVMGLNFLKFIHYFWNFKVILQYQMNFLVFFNNYFIYYNTWLELYLETEQKHDEIYNKFCHILTY